MNPWARIFTGLLQVSGGVVGLAAMVRYWATDGLTVGNYIASLAAYLKFSDTSEVTEWLSGPFYKTVCRVSEGEFKKAKECADYVALTESALDNCEVALAFKPREHWPKSFKYFRLYK